MKAPLSFLFAFVCISQLFTQNSTINLLDFDEKGSSDSTLVFGNYQLNGTKYMVVSNPQKNHINKSEKVVNYTKSTNAELEAGFTMYIYPIYLVPEPYQLCFDYMAPTIGTCRFQLKGLDGKVNSTMVTKNTKVNEWETICSTVLYYGPKDPARPELSANYGFTLFPDDSNWGNGEYQEFYFDNLRINVGGHERAVNFAVDMNSYHGDFEKVFVSGNFNNWSGSADTLYDHDGDGIWELDKMMFDQEIEYVFSLDGWKESESFTGHEECVISHSDGQGGYYRNRIASINRSMNMPAVCYGSCYECRESVQLTWNLNMNGETVSPYGVFLAGGRFGHGVHKMEDYDGDGIYTITLERELGFASYYTFTNGLCPSGWWCKEDLEGQPCAATEHYNDRILFSVSRDMTIDACFGYCSSEGLCESDRAYDVTFNLDTRYLDMSAPVYLAGNTINGWNAGNDLLLDHDNDGVYSITVSLVPGLHLYKFAHDGYWEDLSMSPECTVIDPTGQYINRFVEVVDRDIELDVVVFEECNGFVSTQEVEDSEPMVRAYPTVASDYIYLEFEEKNRSSEVLVYNLMGQLISEQTVNSSYDHQIDLTYYQTGNYFVTVSNDSTKSTIKFVKI